jgi:putative ATP-dependent endonuclease of OLD family
LKFGLTDPLEHYKNLRPYLKNIDVGPEFDPEEMGLGTQSALVIALAEVYRQLVRESAIMLVDEPELYLHPHACRHFYSILKGLSEGDVQVIYTTHSSAFLDVSDYQSIYLVRKTGDSTKVFPGWRVQLTPTDDLKLITRFDVATNEVFFAKAVLLVEGPEDKIAAVKAFELSNINTDKEGISIVACHGKSAMPFMARILTGLMVPTYAICDRDPGKPTEKGSEEIKEIVGDVNFFELPEKLENALGLAGHLNQAEMIEFLDKYSSLDEMPETFKSVMVQVVERTRNILGFDF